MSVLSHGIRNLRVRYPLTDFDAACALQLDSWRHFVLLFLVVIDAYRFEVGLSCSVEHDVMGTVSTRGTRRRSCVGHADRGWLKSRRRTLCRSTGKLPTRNHRRRSSNGLRRGRYAPIHIECMKDRQTLRKGNAVRYGLVVSVETKVETPTSVRDEIRACLRTLVRAQSRYRPGLDGSGPFE